MKKAIWHTVYTLFVFTRKRLKEAFQGPKSTIPFFFLVLSWRPFLVAVEKQDLSSLFFRSANFVFHSHPVMQSSLFRLLSQGTLFFTSSRADTSYFIRRRHIHAHLWIWQVYRWHLRSLWCLHHHSSRTNCGE